MILFNHRQVPFCIGGQEDSVKGIRLSKAGPVNLPGHKSAVFVGKLLVNPRGPEVLVRDGLTNQEEVSSVSGAQENGRQGIQTQKWLHQRADIYLCCGSVWIVNQATTGVRRRCDDYRRGAQALPQALETSEHERPILANRRAQRSPELIP